MNDQDMRLRHQRETAIYQTVGASVRAVRLAQGVSQEELAAAIGVSRETLSRYEHGKRTLPLATLFFIADHLQRPLIDFLPTDVGERTAAPARITLFGSSDQNGVRPEFARVLTLLEQHPDLVPGVESFLEAMTTADDLPPP